MHKLSRMAERNLLKRLRGVKPLSCGEGSSRVVYILPGEPGWVVKVGIGSGGFRQNANERRMFMTYGGERLAEVKAYGRYVVVMERLKCVSYDTGADMACDGDDSEFCDVVEWLNEKLGYSDDNSQLGQTRDGRWKAYDYGFLPDERDEVAQIGTAADICSFGSLNRKLDEYISMLAK